MLAVPLQRIVYRQLLYYSVMKGVVRAIEGTGSGWNKFAKVGETKRFFFTSIVVPVPSSITGREVVAEAQLATPLPPMQEAAPAQGAVSISAMSPSSLSSSAMTTNNK
jgi:hypothetical protein